MGDKPFVFGKEQTFFALCFRGIFGKFLIGVPRKNYAAAELLAVNAAGGKVQGRGIKFHSRPGRHQEAFDVFRIIGIIV